MTNFAPTTPLIPVLFALYHTTAFYTHVCTKRTLDICGQCGENDACTIYHKELGMTNNGTMPDIPIETIAETPNYTVWTADEPDDEKTYHLELGPVTVHFFTEEWDEFVELIREAAKESKDADDGDEEEEATEVELDWGNLYFAKDEWEEFLQLINQV
jgi:hypothetical protein